MTSAVLSLGEEPTVSSAYKFFRGLVRMGLRIYIRKVRMLRVEVLAGSGALILAVSRPVSFREALILVAALPRQVHCVVSRRLLGGLLRKLLARGLGMITEEPEGDKGQSVLSKCCGVLANGKAVVVFSECPWSPVVDQTGPPLTAAVIAVGVRSRHSEQVELSIFPLHIFVPVPRSRSREVLVYLETALFPLEYLSPEGVNNSGGAEALAAKLKERLQENVFRLRPDDVAQFLSDLEEVLRIDMEEDWLSRPNWKQKAEGFELSRIVIEWTKQLNYLNPEHLVSLRESLDAFRKTQRLWSLKQLEVETGGTWTLSAWRRGWVWIETVLEFPLALYGLINHALVLLLLFWTGLLQAESKKSKKVRWLGGAAVVLACYAGQTLVCARLFGNLAALYYVASLPIAGAAVWRYSWLLPHRTRLLILALRAPAQAAKLRRMRKELLSELDRSLHPYVEMVTAAVH